MRNLNRAAVAALLCCFAVSAAVAMPKGGNNGGGGQGGGESSVRLCAEFLPPLADPSINVDGDGLPYCDGTDGEVQADEGLLFSTVRRNPNERRIAVYFHGAYCETTRDATFAAKEVEMDMVGVFGWQKSEYGGALCPQGENDPTDPFDANFNPDALECLEDSEVPMDFQSMQVGADARYMSWRVHLWDPDLSEKKGGEAMLMAFGRSGAIGTNSCTDAGSLPIAIKCTSDDGDTDPKCTGWQVKTFRVCAYDYNADKGGNWNWGGDSCPLNTEIAFVAEP